MSDTPLPDFFIIGAAKAGTTSLHALLSHHTGIFMTTPKEPEFFARDDRYAAGIASYGRLYAAAGPEQLRGEASTIYSLAPLFPRTAARIRKHVPDAKFIYVLRDPVERAYSYYVQLIKNYQKATKDYAVHRCFEEFVLPERRPGAAPREQCLAPFDAHLPDVPELCLAGSDYVRQIEAYFEHFPRDRFLFLTFESFRTDRRAVLRQMTDFLGLAPVPEAAFVDRSTTRNVSRTYFEGVAGTREAERLKSGMGAAWGLRRLLPQNMRRHLKLKLLARFALGEGAHVPPSMEPATRTRLAARFAPDLPRLQALTELDLSGWSIAARAEEGKKAI